MKLFTPTSRGGSKGRVKKLRSVGAPRSSTPITGGGLLTPLATQDDPTAPPRSGSRKLHRLWYNQRGFCWYCGDFTRLPEFCEGRPKNMATVEHIVPRCIGGGPLRQNQVVACNECNNIMSLVDSWVLAIFGRGLDSES